MSQLIILLRKINRIVSFASQQYSRAELLLRSKRTSSINFAKENNLSKKQLVIFFLFFLCVPGLCSFSYAMDDAIIAIVNDELITLKDLRDYIHSNYVSLVAEGVQGQKLKDMMQEFEKEGINRLIEDKLILSKAQSLGLEVREKVVDDRFAEIKSKYPSEEIFMEALIKSGGTITDLKDKIRDQLKIQYIVEHEVKSKIYVNPKEVTNFYQDHLDNFMKKEQVDLLSIFIPFDKDKQSAQQKAQEALHLIQEGKDFEEMAKQYSQMPSLGTIERGQLLPKVEEAVFSLKEGEVSPIIEVDTGLYIFKLKQKIPAQLAGLNEVKDAINNLIVKKKFSEKLRSWINDLKSHAYVEIKQ